MKIQRSIPQVNNACGTFRLTCFDDYLITCTFLVNFWSPIFSPTTYWQLESILAISRVLSADHSVVNSVEIPSSFLSINHPCSLGRLVTPILAVLSVSLLVAGSHHVGCKKNLPHLWGANELRALWHRFVQVSQFVNPHFGWSLVWEIARNRPRARFVLSTFNREYSEHAQNSTSAQWPRTKSMPVVRESESAGSVRVSIFREMFSTLEA